MINIAYAQDATNAVASNSVSGTLIQLIVIFAIFYFILLRPQQKQFKAHQVMLAALKKGDKIITGGGIVGTIVSASDDELEVEISKSTTIKVMRNSIKEIVLPKAINDNKETKKAKK